MRVRKSTEEQRQLARDRLAELREQYPEDTDWTTVKRRGHRAAPDPDTPAQP